MNRLGLLCLVLCGVALSVVAGAALAAAPVIERVELDRGHDVNVGMSGLIGYHERVWVTVSDEDGVADLASVTVTDSAGQPHVITPSGGPDAQWTVTGPTTVRTEWGNWNQPVAPVPGSYSVAIADQEANSDALTTAAAPVVPEVTATILTPDANDALIFSAPSFSWTEGLPGVVFIIAVWEDREGAAAWDYATSSTSANYNENGGAVQPELTPGLRYGWRVMQERSEDAGITDPRVFISTVTHSRGNFVYQPTVPGIPIEGTLFCNSNWYLEGTSEAITRVPCGPTDMAVSPDGTSLVQARGCSSEWGEAGIYRTDRNQGNPVLLTPGLGGTDCSPRWSPDGRQIVFQRANPLPDQSACEAGWEVWVVNSDGTDRHVLVPLSRGGGSCPSFSPDGSSVSFDRLTGPPGPDAPAVLALVDRDGTNLRDITGPGHALEVGRKATWNPDGSQLAVESKLPGNDGSGPGVWHQLVAISPQGTDPRVVFQRFLPDDVTDPSMRYWCGPASPFWSPNGDRIAFVGIGIAAGETDDLSLPWSSADACGLGCMQTDLYLVNADGLSAPTALTQGTWWSERGGTWWAPNTPSGPAVALVKGDATLTFADVVTPGSTGCFLTPDAPGPAPAGWRLVGDCWQITTTATVSGGIGIQLRYDEAGLPSGVAESELRLFWWDGSQWVDITGSLDTENNIVSGLCSGPSYFALAAPAWASVSTEDLEAEPGEVARLPVTLDLGTLQADRFGFSLQVAAQGAAPALAGPLSFVPGPGLPAPGYVDVIGDTIIVGWLSALPAPVTGQVQLGEVLAPVAIGANAGDSYTVSVPSAGASLGPDELPAGGGDPTVLTIAIHRPLLRRVEVDRGRDVSAEGRVTYHERVRVRVAETDGFRDINYVSTVTSGGGPNILSYLGEGGGDLVFEWSAWGQQGPAPPGSYTVTVMDRAGHMDSLTTAPTLPVAGTTPVLLTPDANYAVIADTAPTFSWTAMPAGYNYNLHLWEDGPPEIWYYGTSAGTSVLYNANGQAQLPALQAGHAYDWQIDSWNVSDAGSSDPRVSLSDAPHAYGRFVVSSPDPTIQHLRVWRNRLVDTRGADLWQESGDIAVTDVDGWEDISATVVDGGGAARPRPGDCQCSTTHRGPYTLTRSWSTDNGRPVASAPGSYTVAVQDGGGRTDTLVSLPLVDLPAPPTVTTPANGALILTTRPTISWTAVPGALCYDVYLEEAGYNTPPAWSRVGLPPSVTTLYYDDDGTARDAELTAGAHYRVRVIAHLQDDIWASDRRVSLEASVERDIEFDVAARPAAVPIQGTMMIGRCCGREVFYVSGDSASLTRAPLSIDVGGDLSPDGQRVAYNHSDGLHVANVDGSGDVLLPAKAPCGVRWSPDGQWLAFNMPTEDDPAAFGCGGQGELFVIRPDGTGLRRITHRLGGDLVQDWSPDGRYLLTQGKPTNCAPDQVPPCSVWVNPVDGSESYAIVGPGHPLEWGSAVDWSPDGSRIAMTWQEWPPEGMLQHVGTIAPDGSDAQSLFQYLVPGPSVGAWWLNAGSPKWSPDGTQLAFQSAFHTIPQVGSRSDNEFYLVNADGTNLRRLTYDWNENNLSWVGPNTQPGTDVTVTVTDTTVTFEGITDPGLTTVTVTDVPQEEEPSGFQALGDYLDIHTTASFTGPITIEMYYDDADVPGGHEEWISLLHWETDRWVDITLRPIDTVNNIVRGECDSLSDFTLAVPYWATMAATSAEAEPGGTARVPVTLDLGELEADRFAFSIDVTPNGAAVPLAGPLGFEADPALPAPGAVSPAGTTIGVAWLSTLPAPLTGQVHLGDVLVPLSWLTRPGDSYTASLLSVGASLGPEEVPTVMGDAAAVRVVVQALVGDGYPALTDRTGDGDVYDWGEFGDDDLSWGDAIYTFDSWALPGSLPTGSLRLWAVDSYPRDTEAVVGGDGRLSWGDVITTFDRFADPGLPRPSRRLPAASPAPLRVMAASPVGASRLRLGPAAAGRSRQVRVPVILELAGQRADRVGFTAQLQGPGAKAAAITGFEPARLPAPMTVTRDGGGLSVAWLSPLEKTLTGRVLLGHLVVSVPGRTRTARWQVTLTAVGASLGAEELSPSLGAGPSVSFRVR